MTETQQVVGANFLLTWHMLELTLSKGQKITKFAKTSFVVGTSFCLFVATDCHANICRFRMSVNTLRLLMTTSVLCIITTNRQLISIVGMKKVTSFSACASLLDPVYTDELFSLLCIYLVPKTLIYSSNIVNARDNCVGRLKSPILWRTPCINVVLGVHF